VRVGRSRPARAGEIIATLISGTFLIVLGFVLIFYPPQFMGMQIFGIRTPESTPSGTEAPAAAEEPPPAPPAAEAEDDGRYGNVTLTSLREALEDLEDAGCEIAQVREIQGYSNGVGMLMEYGEFRKIAVKEGMVFLYEADRYSILIIPYESTFVVWVPDELEEQVQYTHFERLEIQTGYATYSGTSTMWTVTLNVKNSGSEKATVKTCFLNDVPCKTANYGVASAPAGEWGVGFPAAGLSLNPGQSASILIYIDNPLSAIPELNLLSSGTTINVKLHSAGGMDYIKLIRLP